MKTWTHPDFNDTRLRKAYVFASAAHAAINQKRKYSGENYIVHPVECVAILQSLPKTSGISVEQECAMMLHDVVEDTRKFVDEDGNIITDTGKFVRSGRKLILVEGITLDLIEDVFSDRTMLGYPTNAYFAKEVRRIVAGLTDVSMPWDGNRTARKALDLAHTAAQAPDVKTNKLADILSNIPSIIEHDVGFARTWVREKRDMLPILKDGDPILYAMVEEIVLDFLNRQHNHGD